MANPRTDHYDGRRYFSPGAPPIPGFRDLLRWSYSRPKAQGWPAWVDTGIHPPPPKPQAGTVSATWINHSTWLFRTPEWTVLTDPVFAKRVGPFGLIGPKRVHAPGIALDALPKIDLILLSHNHYDHCDLQALRYLAARDQPVALSPLGNGPLLQRAGLQNVRELDWWESVAPFEEVAVTATPAQHWSKRLSVGRCACLWSGFSVKTHGFHLSFIGDTGYHPTFFKEIRTRLGAPDLALIPIGAYEPRWFMKGQHVDPEEAVQIHSDLQARLSAAMHWGTFRLTDESRDSPAIELAKALQARAIAPAEFVVLRPGQTLTLSAPPK